VLAAVVAADVLDSYTRGEKMVLDGVRTGCRSPAWRRRLALAVAMGAIVVATTACGGSDTGDSRDAAPSGSSSNANPVAFRGEGTLSMLSSAGFPTLHMQALGTSDGYLLTSRGAGQRSRSCYSSGGWQQRVRAFGGGTTELDLTRSDQYRAIAPFLAENPAIAIRLAALHRPSGWAASSSRSTFAVPAEQLVAVSSSLAPPALRDAVGQATEYAAGTARGPLRVTAWWSSAQRYLPSRVRIVVHGRSPAGQETDAIAWAFGPGTAAANC
jgi:hypothetical protein